MHELPDPLVTMLRAQGVSDAELEELRTTGSIERGGPNGSIHIKLDATDGTGATNVVSHVQSVDVDGVKMGPGSIPPEALEKLKRFHKFIPKASLYEIEKATGEDIDGDGVVGTPGAGAIPAAASTGMMAAATSADTRSKGMPSALANANARAAHHNVSGAMPGQGPFVEKSKSGSIVTWLIVIALVVGVVVFFATR